MAKKRAYTFKHCRVRDCGVKLAAQNRSGFCAKCRETRTADVARIDPKWAAQRRAYFAKWRAKNVKKYGKTRPSPDDIRKASKAA